MMNCSESISITLCRRDLLTNFFENLYYENFELKIAMLGALVLSSSVISIHAYAESGFYLGGSVPQAFVDESGFEDDDTSGKVFGGYRFNYYIAIESAYYNFGEPSENSSRLEIGGGSLGVLGSFPIIGELSVLGKTGIHTWDGETWGVIGNQIDDSSDSDAFYGVGLGYALVENFSIRVEVERYEVDDDDVDVASFGASFHF